MRISFRGYRNCYPSSWRSTVCWNVKYSELRTSWFIERLSSILRIRRSYSLFTIYRWSRFRRIHPFLLHLLQRSAPGPILLARVSVPVRVEQRVRFLKILQWPLVLKAPMVRSAIIRRRYIHIIFAMRCETRKTSNIRSLVSAENYSSSSVVCFYRTRNIRNRWPMSSMSECRQLIAP